jgi:hypothetical protein
MIGIDNIMFFPGVHRPILPGFPRQAAPSRDSSDLVMPDLILLSTLSRSVLLGPTILSAALASVAASANARLNVAQPYAWHGFA